MRKIKSLKVGILAGLFLCLLMLIPADVLAAGIKANSWVTKETGRYYYGPDKVMYKNRAAKIGRYYYVFDKQGIMQKSRLVTVKGATYYVNAKGRALTEKLRMINGANYYFAEKGKMYKNKVAKIGSYYYAFDKKGKRVEEGMTVIRKNTYYVNLKHRVVQDKKVSLEGKTYYFQEDGRMLKNGWKIFGTYKSYFNKYGVMLKNRKVDGIKLDDKGKAELTEEEALKVRVIPEAKKLVARITSPGQTKAQKLQLCWNYLNKSNYNYATWRFDFNRPDWAQIYAMDIFDKKSGNCYSFAAAFGYMAKVIGYKDVVLIQGRVQGTRDGAADGLTGHGWVKIDGLYYDPEAHFAGWMNCYASPTYPATHQIRGYYPI